MPGPLDAAAELEEAPSRIAGQGFIAERFEARELLAKSDSSWGAVRRDGSEPAQDSPEFRRQVHLHLVQDADQLAEIGGEAAG